MVNSFSHLKSCDDSSSDIRLYQCIFYVHVYDDPSVPSATKEIFKKDPDASLRNLFGWFSSDIIKKNFQHITHYARLPTGNTLKTSFNSQSPAHNVPLRNETFACDIVYSDVPAIDDGSISAVIFAGTDTQVKYIHCIKSDRQFVNTLEDFITQHGSP
jgi:hypothetical protein